MEIVSENEGSMVTVIYLLSGSRRALLAQPLAWRRKMDARIGVAITHAQKHTLMAKKALQTSSLALRHRYHIITNGVRLIPRECCRLKKERRQQVESYA